MKNPVLSIGMLFMAIFLMDLGRKGKLPWPSERVIPSSCRSALVMLERRIPANWKAKCNNENLTVTIESRLKAPDIDRLRAALYREMANNLIFIAKNSLNESLERTLIVRLETHHPVLIINAISEGKYVAKLATLKRPDFIATHLQSTVQVQEKLVE